MATIPTLTHALFTTPFSHCTDFTELADNCERFAEALAECDDPQQKMALCGRLSACLTLLQPTLLDPVPEHLKASLTVENVPGCFPLFEPEADQLCGYCQTLTQLLMSGTLAPKSESVVRDLLYRLVDFFADTMKAPRWLKQGDTIIEL
ncbi:hypothetical protein SAMN05192562_102168 [Kosakonia arachidis]|uniref:Uncharacterized protein n=1 Tax=Kosakonia arachidis TaxID=551989 RepID=A0A1I7AYX1_9ENTR|nr:hypothetical protein SAMN05192562_102168 [Kosakonia arachidis]